MLGLGVSGIKFADFSPGTSTNDLPASTDVGDVSWVFPRNCGGKLRNWNALSHMAMVAQGKSACVKGHGACRNGYGDDGGRDHQPRAAPGRWADLKNGSENRDMSAHCQTTPNPD